MLREAGRSSRGSFPPAPNFLSVGHLSAMSGFTANIYQFLNYVDCPTKFHILNEVVTVFSDIFPASFFTIRESQKRATKSVHSICDDTFGLVEAKMIYLLGSFKNYIQEAGDAKEEQKRRQIRGQIFFNKITFSDNFFP